MSGRLRRSLHAKVDRLSDSAADVVERVVDAVLLPVDKNATPGSWLTTTVWADAFEARLKAHHALSNEPLATTNFEAAFNGSCRTAGWSVEPAPSATHRFFDTTVTLPGAPSRRLSLKSTSARDLRPGVVHISKLTEAAWVQDARLHRERRMRLAALFHEYRQNTDSIVILRCFKLSTGGLKYELVEIPTSIFEPIEHITVAQATSDTIEIPAGARPPDLAVRIDRSDAKITITRLRISLCTVHGWWELKPQSR